MTKTTENKLSKKLLLVTTSFPPMGGPGVQRNLKFTKYWPKYNWIPHILTPKEIHFPLKDYKLLQELPEEATIHRTETLDPRRIFFRLKGLKKGNTNEKLKNRIGNTEKTASYKFYKFLRRWFFIPDVGILWAPFAIVKGLKVIRKNKINVIIGSCPGPSNIMIAMWLSSISKVPFVLDFRDGWTDYPYNEYPTRFHIWINKILEKQFIPKAGKLITYGPYLTNCLIERYGIEKDRFLEITNGFDPEDFNKIEIRKNNTEDIMTIVHSGNIYKHRKPVFENLVTAFSQLPITIRSKYKFDLIGSCFEGAQDFVISKNVKKHFNFIGYLDHASALERLVKADVTLILLPKGDFAAFTGKVFEYIAIGKLIIELGEPKGSCGKLLKDIMPFDTIAFPDNIEKIKSILTIALEYKNFSIPIEIINKYSRERQAQIFAEAINAL